MIRLLTVFLVFFLLLCNGAFAQMDADQDWNAFYQTIDLTNYKPGKFRLKAFVRTEKGDKETQSRLYARTNTRKGIEFFDNMVRRPIEDSTWQEYTIEGAISAKVQTLSVGGLFFGFSIYHFDNFTLEFQRENQSWQPCPLVNGGFESGFPEGWKFYYNVKGYNSNVTTAESTEGKQSLIIDGLKRSALSYGNNRETGSYRNVNGIRVYYEVYGDGQPLLLLHGNGQSIKVFKSQIPEFAKKFKVIALDSRGQGRTSEDGKRLTYELMAEDVNAFLDDIGLREVDLLGWSDGGNTGLILAMQHPEKVKRLAVMGAVLFNNNTSIADKTNKMLQAAKEKWEKENDGESAFNVRLMDLIFEEPNLKPEQLHAIKCPTLVMAGSNDLVKKPHTKLIAANIAGSRLVIFPKGTHFEPVENPARFNKAVLDFFDVPYPTQPK